jgi:hypothetical protein
MFQKLLRCTFEIREAVANQRRFPEELKGALLGEMDHREEMMDLVDLVREGGQTGTERLKAPFP